MTEQRECERVSAEYDAEVRAHGDHEWWKGSVADIGEKGCRLWTEGGPRLEPGTGVWLRIKPRESTARLVVRGSVVRCMPSDSAGHYEVACQFA